MKRYLMKVWHFIQMIFLFILGLFARLIPEKKEKSLRSEKKDLFSNTFEQKIIIKIKENEDSETNPDASRDLFKEYIKVGYYYVSEEKVKSELNNTIEQIFKIDIKQITPKEKDEINKYTKKIFGKVTEKIKEEKIQNEENLKIYLKEQVKNDIEIIEKNKSNIQSKEKMLFISNPKIKNENQPKPLIKESKIENLKEPIKGKEIEIIPILPFLQEKKEIKEKDISVPVLENFEIKKEESIKLQEEQITPMPETLETKKEHCTSISETLSPKEKLVISIPEVLEKKEEKDRPLLIEKSTFLEPKLDEKKENKTDVNKNETLVNKEIKIDNKKTGIDKKSEGLKEEKAEELKINMYTLEQQNDRLIDQSKKEIEKEDFIDKEYEEIEKRIEEKISEIEILLTKNVAEVQKSKLKKELIRLKEIEQNVYLHKEQDLEVMRKALEESISLKEINIIKENFQQFYKDNELQKQEILFENMKLKSAEEMRILEKEIVKKSFKKTLRRLEIPLFLSFPFIKNKYFRRFVSGLFIFRSFQFIKNILFGSPNEYVPLDLSYMQKGKDALEESLLIMEKNINLFEDLKKTTFLKYPELAEDEEFMIYINKLENNLTKKYEKLIKEKNVVNKYFQKSNILVRKRKKL